MLFRKQWPRLGRLDMWRNHIFSPCLKRIVGFTNPGLKLILLSIVGSTTPGIRISNRIDDFQNRAYDSVQVDHACEAGEAIALSFVSECRNFSVTVLIIDR